MKLKTIKLHSSKDGMREYRGYVFGNLAVHRDIRSQEASRSKPNYWVVSHLLTGLLVQCVSTAREGREFVDAVADLDWSSDHNDIVAKTVKDDVISRRRELGYVNAYDKRVYA